MKNTACADPVKQSSLSVPSNSVNETQVHEHNHPHVLMLQIANAFFKLPGDYLLPHETEISGFQSRLAERLSPPVGSSIAEQFMDGEEGPYDWRIHDCVAQWWRPNFETFMYPFIPAHVTRPKECKKMYLIQLPKKSIFLPFPFHLIRMELMVEMLSVPKNMKLLAVPLFELYDNTARYGPQLSVCSRSAMIDVGYTSPFESV
jgi:cleavage and polyadenylation specificity factor subunit 5